MLFKKLLLGLSISLIGLSNASFANTLVLRYVGNGSGLIPQPTALTACPANTSFQVVFMARDSADSYLCPSVFSFPSVAPQYLTNVSGANLTWSTTPPNSNTYNAADTTMNSSTFQNITTSGNNINLNYTNSASVNFTYATTVTTVTRNGATYNLSSCELDRNNNSAIICKYSNASSQSNS